MLPQVTVADHFATGCLVKDDMANFLEFSSKTCDKKTFML
jgi:hypothetical protein